MGEKEKILAEIKRFNQMMKSCEADLEQFVGRDISTFSEEEVEKLAAIVGSMGILSLTKKTLVEYARNTLNVFAI